MDRNENLNRKFNYLQNLCDITFKDLPEALINACQIDINFDFKDNLDSLIKIDKSINQLKKRVRKVHNTNKDLLDECKDLYHRLSLVHKAIYETMKTEFGICDCWENEEGKVEYARY